MKTIFTTTCAAALAVVLVSCASIAQASSINLCEKPVEAIEFLAGEGTLLPDNDDGTDSPVLYTNLQQQAAGKSLTADCLYSYAKKEKKVVPVPANVNSCTMDKDKMVICN